MSSRKQNGFTYLMLLWWVAISGVVLMAISHSWVLEARREREAELIFRGEQIRAALLAYAKVPVADGLSPWPSSLQDLLEDQRSGKIVRHLRQVWPDPITHQPWGLLKDRDGIHGVYSRSEQAPIHPPDGVEHYRQWLFEAAALSASPPASATSEPSSSPL